MIRALLLTGIFFVTTVLAATDTYPNKPVHIIVPFVPGGPTDNQGRWAAQQLNQAFGQAFIIENKPGGGGVPGSDFVAKSVPDGYTLLAGNPGPLTVAPAVKSQMPYDTLKDFVPVMLIARSASCLAIHPSVPAKNLQEFIQYAKQNPNKVNYGSPGYGTVGHLGVELFATHVGIKLNHVPYKGASQYLNDLLAGHIDLAIVQFAACEPLLKQGKLRALGATSEKRSALLPDLPTLAEQGLKGFQSYNWNGVLAPAGTSKEIVQKIYQILSKQIALPENQNIFLDQGHEPRTDSPEEFAEFLKNERLRMAKVAKEANIHE